jgi:hypothetical protein
MSKYEAECLICGIVQEVGCYDDWTCKGCGQEYRYSKPSECLRPDGGCSIVLSEKQLGALRALFVVERVPIESDGGKTTG